MEEKQIIFLEPWPTVMVYKMAKTFKDNGYSLISIRILGSDKSSDKFYKEVFDEIISFDLTFFKIEVKNIFLILYSLFRRINKIFAAIVKISKLKPYIIFARATPSWPCALTKILFKKYPLIYLAYDVRSSKASSKQITKKVHRIPEFELRAEKFCFEKSDGILSTGGPGQLNNLNEEIFGKDFKIKKPKMNFYSYCLRDFFVPLNRNKISKKDKEIRMVYIGSVGSVGLKSHNYLFEQFNEIAKQKIHVHIYGVLNTSTKTPFIDQNMDQSKELLKTGYFHVHSPLGPKEIIKEISKYDFGLLLGSDPIPKNCPRGIFSVGNKISSYLEAGIPCIYEEKYTSTNKIMKKYGLYLPFRERNLKKYLNGLDYKLLEKKILKAREDFLMEKNFPRLEKFIEKIRKNTIILLNGKIDNNL